MNIQPNHSVNSVAGSHRAARKGGESEKQAGELSRATNSGQAPAGESADIDSIDKGDQTRDRNGDGRQALARETDRFEKSGSDDANSLPMAHQPIDDEDSSAQVDYEA